MVRREKRGGWKDRRVIAGAVAAAVALPALPPAYLPRRASESLFLELREPQAEWRELRKIWEKGWKEGYKDQKTGTIVALPIDEAKIFS